jgi:hypothetical protein
MDMTKKQKRQMSGCDNEGYDNEGFLYINNRHYSQKKEDDAITFKKGMIRDSDGQLICLGEIVPIVASHLDEDFATYMTGIQYWIPVIRGVKIRVYWHAASEMFNISSPGKIYPDESILFIAKAEINKQIDFSLLDKTQCYYAIIERGTQIIYLTHIVSNILSETEPTMTSLDHLLCVEDDRAFKTHIVLQRCETEEEVMRLLTKEKKRQMYGVVFIRADGQLIESTSREYEKIRMLEKPDYIDYAEYYIHALNKYPDESEPHFENYFEKELHYDITNELYVYFPEYAIYFEVFKKNLKAYIDCNFEDDALSENTGIVEDDDDFLLENTKNIKNTKDYIEIYYEITKNSINPIFQYKEEEESSDMKKIRFARKLIETSSIDAISRVLLFVS